MEVSGGEVVKDVLLEQAGRQQALQRCPLVRRKVVDSNSLSHNMYSLQQAAGWLDGSWTAAGRQLHGSCMAAGGQLGSSYSLCKRCPP